MGAPFPLMGEEQKHFIICIEKTQCQMRIFQFSETMKQLASYCFMSLFVSLCKT